MLTEYLNVKAPHLVQCVDRLVDGQHTRFVEAIAISFPETSFCTTGNGVNGMDNCVNMGKHLRLDDPLSCGVSTPGRWECYRDRCASFIDLADSMEQRRYKGKTIEDMNGEYCQNENQATMHLYRECPGWTDDVMSVVNEIRSMM